MCAHVRPCDGYCEMQARALVTKVSCSLLHSRLFRSLFAMHAQQNLNFTNFTLAAAGAVAEAHRGQHLR